MFILYEWPGSSFDSPSRHWTSLSSSAIRTSSNTSNSLFCLIYIVCGNQRWHVWDSWRWPKTTEMTKTMTKNLVFVFKGQERWALGFHTLADSPAAGSTSYAARKLAPACLSLQLPFLLCTLRSVQKAGNRVIMKGLGFVRSDVNLGYWDRMIRALWFVCTVWIFVLLSIQAGCLSHRGASDPVSAFAFFLSSYRCLLFRLRRSLPL